MLNSVFAHHKRRGFLAVAAVLWIGAIVPAAGAAEPAAYKLRPGDRLAILGDSITERKGYSVFVEAYIIACAPANDVKMMQFGWSGETACGFTYRMEKDLMPWKPTVATICYGKNDGHYRKYEDELGELHDESMRKIVSRLKDSGATVVVGTPGLMDTFYYKATPADIYNESLGRLAAIDKKIAEDLKQPFADINTVMLDAMQKSKAAYGQEYNVMGGHDSVHPYANGHLIMAYAFLKALGMDGRIATITVDWTGKSEATEGHKLRSVSSGVVEVESARYAFCFKAKKEGDKEGEETASVLPFLPFQQDLNRFVLVVKNLPTEQAAVKWGAGTKTFSRQQLGQGINLAAEFLDNPMCKPFEAVIRAVEAKQGFETASGSGIRTYSEFLKKDLKDDAETTDALAVLQRKLQESRQVKVADSIRYKTKRQYLDLNATILDRYRKYEEELDKLNKSDPEITRAIEILRPQLLAAQEKYCAKVRAQVKPVTHTIEITPIATK